MVLRKTDMCVCCSKDKLTDKHVGSTLRLHFQQVSHLSMSNSCDTEQPAHRQAQIHEINLFIAF